jgi:6-phosphofructo-2-kinase/fructose-2,6-biphosphatase
MPWYSIHAAAFRAPLNIAIFAFDMTGKTWLCNKLVCYLNWLGHSTRLFNVGSYRRLQKSAEEVQVSLDSS